MLEIQSPLLKLIDFKRPVKLIFMDKKIMILMEKRIENLGKIHPL